MGERGNLGGDDSVRKDGKGIDESTDMYDTVDWLLKNVAGNNGRVGIQGISYPGFYTAASIIDGHPAIKAASPQAPMIEPVGRRRRLSRRRVHAGGEPLVLCGVLCAAEEPAEGRAAEQL